MWELLSFKVAKSQFLSNHNSSGWVVLLCFFKRSFFKMEKICVFNKEHVFDILLNEPDRVLLETRDPQVALSLRLVNPLILL